MEYSWIPNIFSILLTAYTIISLSSFSLNKAKKILLYAYFLIIGLFGDFIFGLFFTPFLLLGMLLIFYVFSSRFRLWNMLLSLVAWMWCVLSNYLASSLFILFGYQYETMHTSSLLVWISLLFQFIFAAVPATFTGRWLQKKLAANPDLIPHPMLRLLFGEVLVCTGIFLFNIIWGSLENFPTVNLLFNGILFAGFAIANLFLYINLYRTASENQRLALQAQAQESLSEYTQQLESHYQEMRRFRHDYMNLLATLNGYIHARDWNELETFFESKIMGSSRSLASKDAMIGKLSNMKILEIKGIIYTKIIEALNRQLNVTLELTDEITYINMDLLALSRILGIYLDNAIEASETSEARKLSIIIYIQNSNVFFHIKNSTKPLTAPLEKLSEQNFTTKENHSGLGLYTVQTMAAAITNLDISTEYKDGIFSQALIIHNNGT